MIEKYSDFGFTKEDSWEDLLSKIKEKLGISIDDMRNVISEYLKKNAETMAEGFRNIAPMGRYGDLIEDRNEMISFIRDEASKPEYWELRGCEPTHSNPILIKFSLSCTAIDDGENCFGFVFSDFSGKIKHAFAQSEDDW